MINLDCPKCQEPLAFADERRGDDVRCPRCRSLLRLPARRPAAGTPAPTSRPPMPAKPKPPRDDDVIAEVAVVGGRRKTRRKRRRSPAGGSFEMPDWVVPLVLFACAALTNALLALRDTENGKGLLVFAAIDLAVTVPVTIGGMVVAAAALGVNFGDIVTACLKVAAVVSVVQCIYLVGMLGETGDRSAAVVLLLAAPVYWGLFAWLFELTFVEAIQATVLIGLIQKGVNTLLSLLVAGILLKVAATS